MGGTAAAIIQCNIKFKCIHTHVGIGVKARVPVYLDGGMGLNCFADVRLAIGMIASSNGDDGSGGGVSSSSGDFFFYDFHEGE